MLDECFPNQFHQPKEFDTSRFTNNQINNIPLNFQLSKPNSAQISNIQALGPVWLLRKCEYNLERTTNGPQFN